MNNFNSAFSLIQQQFLKVIATMDSFNIFGNFSVLDFFVALLVLGAILPIVIITVSNWSSGAISGARSRSSVSARQSKNEINIK